MSVTESGTEMTLDLNTDVLRDKILETRKVKDPSTLVTKKQVVM